MHDAPAGPPAHRPADGKAGLGLALAAAALVSGMAGAGLAAWALLAFYALLGPVQAIRALALSWLFLSLSPALVGAAAEPAVGRHLVLGAAAVSTGLRALSAPRPGVISAVDLCTLLLGAYVLLHAVVLSHATEVSLLRGLSWLAAALVAAGGWARLTAGERERLGWSLWCGLCAVVLAGLPLLASPAGYAPWGDFQGVLRYPTLQGIAAALLGAWSIALLFERRRAPLALIAVAAASGVLVMLSGSRTAAVAMFAGVGISLLAFNSGLSLRLLAVGGHFRHRTVNAVGARAVPVVFWSLLGGYGTRAMNQRAGWGLRDMPVA